MLRFIPDWLIYTLALSGVLWAIFSPSVDQNAPPPPPEAIQREGAMLPPASAFDERVLVQVTRPQTGIGTAFSISSNGDWLTARHVVEGCEDIGLLVAPNKYVNAQSVTWSEKSDLALIRTAPLPLEQNNPVILDTSSDLRVGNFGYHIGYPQGRPGEAVSRLMSRSRLISSGEREGNEPVLAWAEAGRTEGLRGTLGGLSGGPVFDDLGRVRGVIIAESPRRGRIYTSSPEAIEDFLIEQNVLPQGDPADPISPETYGNRADQARRALQVVKIACEVETRS